MSCLCIFDANTYIQMRRPTHDLPLKGMRISENFNLLKIYQSLFKTYSQAKDYKQSFYSFTFIKTLYGRSLIFFSPEQWILVFSHKLWSVYQNALEGMNLPKMRCQKPTFGTSEFPSIYDFMNI